MYTHHFFPTMRRLASITVKVTAKWPAGAGGVWGYVHSPPLGIGDAYGGAQQQRTCLA